jgi:DNA-binding CsgD family transcriptional regulator
MGALPTGPFLGNQDSGWTPSSVQAAVSALAAHGGTVTWLSIRAAGQEPPPGTDPVGGPLLASSAPLRVLVCAPDPGRAHALSGPFRAALDDAQRVARCAPAPDAVRHDVLTAPGADTVVVAPGPDGGLCAQLPGPALNGLVQLLVDALWDAALPLSSAEHFERVTGDPVKLKILSLLESGAKDEAIARALGVSLRTCRRHIAEILATAGAVNRFQAAVRFARAGVLGAAPCAE